MSTASATVIDAEAILFSELFCKGCFDVPWHQRHYDWNEKDVTALLLDIEEAVRERRSCYFLGAMILVECGNGIWEINDGQQRMITVSLIFAALCRRFFVETHDSQREGLALRMLFSLHSAGDWSLSDAENYKPRINPPLGDRAYYWQLIRGNKIGTNGKLTSAWRVIDDYFGATNEESRWEEYFDYMREHLEVACLEVPDEIDPNSVFETINCRGKPLDELDLIRNFIYSFFNAPSEEKRRNTVHDSLELIREMFPRTKTTNKGEDYVRCRMQCRFGFLPKDSLYNDVRRRVREEVTRPRWRNKPTDFVFQLAREITKPEDLELYRRLTVPTASPEYLQAFEAKANTTHTPRSLTAFLRELKTYSVTHTLVFALLAKYVHATDGRTQRRVARLVSRNLGRLATFVMRTAFVAPKFEPSRFEQRFADFASQIATSDDIPDAQFAEFLLDCDRSEYGVLDDGKFKGFMVEAEMRGNKKIKSLLLGINRVGHEDAILLSDGHCSVEHVLPTGDEHWQGWTGFRHVNPSDWTRRIGNMTLMARGDIRPGGKFNGSFEKKVEVYRESSVSITREIAKIDSWSPNHIEERQRTIAEQAANVWSFE